MSESQVPPPPPPMSPPPPPPFGQDSTLGYGGAQPKISGMALASMILGIIGIPLMCALGIGLIPAIIAVILGIVALNAINKNPMQKSGKGFAIAGIVLGCVSLPLAALMLAITIPSLGKARELSNRSVCAANLRGMAQSINIYAADNDDAYPIVSPVGRYALAGSGSPNVTENMFILVSTGQVAPKQFLCKSDPSPVTPAPSAGTDFASDMNYSYSFAYPWTATPPRALSGSTVPTNIGAWWRNQTDASLPLMADMAPLNGTGSPAATTTDSSSKNSNSFNHQRDGQNVAFGDAHAEFCRTPAAGQSNDNIYTSSGGTPDPTGTAFPGGAVPAIGNGGGPGNYDICMVPAADGSSHARH